MNYGLFPGFPQQALANLSHGCAVFTSAESGRFFLVPDGVYEVFVLLVGGGGTGNRSNQGGQAGEILSRRVAVIPGQQIRVTIGAGGVDTVSPQAGGASSFGQFVTAAGGALGGESVIRGAPGLGRGGATAGSAGTGFGAGGAASVVGGYAGSGAAGGCWVFW